MPLNARTNADRALLRHLIEVAKKMRPSIVAAYGPLSERLGPEPGGQELVVELANACPNVLLPRVEHNAMHWNRYDGSLRAAGTFQEACGPTSSLLEADLIIVPALAVDRNGMRLGRGGGYYDRALKELRTQGLTPLTVTLLYDDEFVEKLPTEEHDMPVSAVITPTGGWRDLGADVR